MFNPTSHRIKSVEYHEHVMTSLKSNFIWNVKRKKRYH